MEGSEEELEGFVFQEPPGFFRNDSGLIQFINGILQFNETDFSHPKNFNFYANSTYPFPFNINGNFNSVGSVNGTSFGQQPGSDFSGYKIAVIIAYSIIFLLSTVGNGLVICTLVWHRKMRSVTNIFLLNLAISDLLIALVCLPTTIIGQLLKHFIFGRIVCKLIPYLQGVSVSVSVYTLISIAIERYYAICQPLKSKSWQTSSHSYKMIATNWILNLIFNLPFLFISELIQVRNSDRFKCRERWPNIQSERIFNVLFNFFILLIPLFILIVSYSLIVNKLWKGLRSEIKHTRSTKTRRGRERNRRNSMEMECYTTGGGGGGGSHSQTHSHTMIEDGITISNYSSFVEENEKPFGNSSGGGVLNLSNATDDEVMKQRLMSSSTTSTMSSCGVSNGMSMIESGRKGIIVRWRKERRKETPPTRSEVVHEKKTKTDNASCSSPGGISIPNNSGNESRFSMNGNGNTRLLSSSATSSSNKNNFRGVQGQNLQQQASKTSNTKSQGGLLRSSYIEKSIEAKKKVIRMLFVLVIEFFICWGPLNVVNLIYSFNSSIIEQNIGPRGILLLHLLSYTSACTNPLTYCFMHTRFRKSFINVFKCKCIHPTHRGGRGSNNNKKKNPSIIVKDYDTCNVSQM